MDILFLHVPKFRNYYKPIGSFSFINLPPMGLLGLADYARQNGLSTQIVHLGVEREKRGKMDLDQLISEFSPSLVALDLHWHFQSYDVIEVARQIKRTYPHISILLGGFTASYFAEEIIREFDCIDFVIRGDAEIPIVSLMKHLKDGAYEQVPNLVYRHGETVHVGDISYIATSAILEQICYTDFTLMRDYPLFVEGFSNYMSVDGLSSAAQRKLFHWKRSYPVFLGRGCVYGCSCCGGANEAQRIINNRHLPVMRSVSSVLSSIRDLDHYGFEHGYIALDTLPAHQAETYYLELFNGIRALGTRMSFEVERYLLPSKHFIRSFRECLSKGSYVTLSPNSHDEEIRRKNRMYRYSNKELEESISMMEEEGVKCALFFSSGLPFETEDSMNAMVEYQRYLRTSFGNLKIKNGIIEVEPGSPMTLHPTAYGVHPHRNKFKEYYDYHSDPTRNQFSELGYDREGCPGPDKVTSFFCGHLCTHYSTGSLPPSACKLVCNCSTLFRKVGGFKLLNRIFGSRTSLAAQSGSAD